MWFVAELQFLVEYFVVVAVAVVTPSAEPALVAVVESLTFEFVVLVGPDGQSATTKTKTKTATTVKNKITKKTKGVEVLIRYAAPPA